MHHADCTLSLSFLRFFKQVLIVESSAVSVAGRLLDDGRGIHPRCSPLPTPPPNKRINPTFPPIPLLQGLQDAYHPHQTPYHGPRPLLQPIIIPFKNLSICANPREGPLYFSPPPPPPTTYPCHSHIGTIETMEAHS